jgi:hypothetical protein
VKLIFWLALLCLAALPAHAQDNYEIQVYGADTVPPDHLMVELHTNYTLQGSKLVTDGVQPSNHAWHETLEITRGFNSWFETGFYVFTSIQPGGQWDWVGDHIRPRVRVPESWHWPVGVSLSTEVGYQRRSFATDTWTLELRPIVDKQLGPWYLSFNPSLDRAFAGADASRGFEFSPNFKVSYNVTPVVAAGLEYYGSLGPLGNFDPLHDQQQQIVPSIDLNVSPDWEFNFGVGLGVTHGTDRLLVKMIVGRRFMVKG